MNKLNIKEAMKLFNINDVEEISEDNVKKKWKKLMLEAHPDRGGEHTLAVKYNEAYKLLKQCASKLNTYIMISRKEEAAKTFLISLLDLIELYAKDKGIKCKSKSGENFEITKYNINQLRVLLEIPIELTFREVTESNSFIVIKNIKDNYNITIQVEDNNIFEPVEVTIKLSDKEIKTTMSQPIMGFLFKMDYNIYVHVQIERIDRNGQKDDEDIDNRL